MISKYGAENRGGEYQSDGNVGRIREDERDFLKLAAPAPVLCKKDPTGISCMSWWHKQRASPSCARVTQAVSNDDSRSVLLEGRNDERCSSSHVSEHI
jgi:hypothetical protein